MDNCINYFTFLAFLHSLFESGEWSEICLTLHDDARRSFAYKLFYEIVVISDVCCFLHVTGCDNWLLKVAVTVGLAFIIRRKNLWPDYCRQHPGKQMHL